MGKTILRRLLVLMPQLVFVTILVFILSEVMPGDPFMHLLEDSDISLNLAGLEQIHGLDLPFYERYFRWLGAIVTDWDFGVSIQHHRPVIDIISERMGNTLRLSALTLFFTYLIAVPLGVIAGRNQGKVIDKVILLYAFTALAIPTVVLSIVVIYVFGFRGGWVPISGSVDVLLTTGTWSYYMSRLHHLIAPALTGAVLNMVGIIFFLRNEIVDVIGSEYVTTARSKGASKGDIYRRHVLRNALLPIAPSIGAIVSALFAGSIFIERVFSFPGIGTLFLTSIIQQDFSVVNTLVLMTSVLTAISVLFGDVLLMIIDPRISIR